MRPSGRHLLLVPVVALGEVGVDVEKVNLVTRGLHNSQTNRKKYFERSKFLWNKYVEPSLGGGGGG
jgi:phosphopantetheinyl transferase